MTGTIRVLIGVAAMLALAGCAPTGDIRDPAVRRVTWFGFISGDDMQCETGIDRLRLVHNAIWDKDVRVIEATEVPGAPYRVEETLLPEADWSEVVLGAGSSTPWRGEAFAGSWTAAQYAAVVDALAADGAFTPLAAPVTLESRGFFWTGTGCKDGKPWFHAWAYPSAAYADLRFPASVAPILPSGQAFATAHPVTQPYPDYDPKERRDFQMKATSSGISGRFGLPRPPLNRFLP